MTESFQFIIGDRIALQYRPETIASDNKDSGAEDSSELQKWVGRCSRNYSIHAYDFDHTPLLP
jgi:hypothetical protein